MSEDDEAQHLEHQLRNDGKSCRTDEAPECRPATVAVEQAGRFRDDAYRHVYDKTFRSQPGQQGEDCPRAGGVAGVCIGSTQEQCSRCQYQGSWQCLQASDGPEGQRRAQRGQSERAPGRGVSDCLGTQPVDDEQEADARPHAEGASGVHGGSAEQAPDCFDSNQERVAEAFNARSAGIPDRA